MTLSRLSFGLLVLGEAILLALVLIGGARYPGYDHASQFISELGATGAVDGWGISWIGFLSIGVLVGAFCLISAWLMRSRIVGLIGWLLLAFNAYAYLNSVWFRCSYECAGETPAQVMHNLVGALGYLAGCIGLVLAGLSARNSKASWLVALGIVCAILSFVGLFGLGSTTELRGAFQRLTEVSIAVFMLAFGWALATERVGKPDKT